MPYLVFLCGQSPGQKSPQLSVWPHQGLFKPIDASVGLVMLRGRRVLDDLMWHPARGRIVVVVLVCFRGGHAPTGGSSLRRLASLAVCDCAVWQADASLSQPSFASPPQW